MEALPAALAPAKADLAKLEALLAMEQKKIDETETWRLAQETDIKREEEAVRAAKTKLQSSSNTREYASANREIANKRKNISSREDEVLKVFDAMEQTKKSLETHTADVEKLRGHVTAEESSLSGKLEELAAEAAKIEAERGVVAGQIEASALKRYEHALRSRAPAIVKVQSGVCTGCNVKLPPQLANELARFESIETCPQCHRLLYHSSLVETEEDQEAAS